MLLIKPQAVVLPHLEYGQMLSIVCTAVSHCYKAEVPKDQKGREDFIRRRLKAGHETVIEHVGFSADFQVDRGVTHEMVRHRVCSFTQESTRYCDYDGEKEGGEVKFIIPAWCTMVEPGQYSDSGMQVEKAWAAEENLPEDQWVWFASMRSAEKNYKMLRSLGWGPEKARAVLPNATKAGIVWSANMREWRHIFKLRALGTTGRPHPQMVEVMLPLLYEARKRFPVFFEDL